MKLSAAKALGKTSEGTPIPSPATTYKDVSKGYAAFFARRKNTTLTPSRYRRNKK
jgi:hypothetical protein